MSDRFGFAKKLVVYLFISVFIFSNMSHVEVNSAGDAPVFQSQVTRNIPQVKNVKDYFDFVMDSQNNLYAIDAFNAQANSYVQIKQLQAGEWIDIGDRIEPGHSMGSIAVVIDNNDEMIVSYSESFTSGQTQETFFERWDGSAWVALPRISSSTPVQDSKLLVTSTNDILYIHQNTKPRIYQLNGTWSELPGGEVSSYTTLSYDVALDDNDNPVILYNSNSSLNNYLMEVKRHNGSAWEQVGTGVAIGESVSKGESSVVVDSSNEVVIAYAQNNSGAYNSRVFRENGAAWSQIGGDLSSGETMPLVDLRLSGNSLHVQSSEVAGGVANYSFSTFDGAAWQSTDLTEDTPYPTSTFFTYWFDTNGLLYFEFDGDVYTRSSTVELLVPENNPNPGTVIATDDDSGIDYSVVGGVDEGLVSIDGVTGEVSMVNNPDYEEPSDSDLNNNYYVEVQAEEQGGSLSSSIYLKVGVQDTDDLQDLQYNANLKTYWQQVTDNEQFEGVYGYLSKLVLDSNSVPIVVHKSTSAGGVSVSRKDGDQWVSVGNDISSQAVTSLDLAIDSQDDLYMAVYDNPGFELSVYSLQNGVWTQLGGVIDTNNSSIYDLEIGSDGVPVITYANGANTAEIITKRFENNTWSDVGGGSIVLPGNIVSLGLDFDDSVNPVIAAGYNVGGRGGTGNIDIYSLTNSAWGLPNNYTLADGLREFDFALDSDGNAIFGVSTFETGMGVMDLVVYEDAAWTSTRVDELNGTFEEVSIIDTDGVYRLSYANISDGELFTKSLVENEVIDIKTLLLASQMSADSTQLLEAGNGVLYLGVQNEVTNSYNLYTFEPITLEINTNENILDIGVLGDSYEFAAPQFQIVGGEDSGEFDLDAGSGALSFVASPDYEQPLDSDSNNEYNLLLVAQEGTEFQPNVLKSINVIVSDIDENPKGDQDLDGVSNEIEQAGPNNGDANNDSVPDHTQSEVVSIAMSSGSYITLDGGSCDFRNVAIRQEAELDSEDQAYDYPDGLLEFVGNCPSLQLTLLDHQNSTSPLRKYVTDYQDLNTQQDFVTIDGSQVTRYTYEVMDGGELDAGPAGDGVVKDPIGFGVAPLGLIRTGGK